MAGERERLVKGLKRIGTGENLYGRMEIARQAADLLEADAAELAALRKDAERYQYLRNLNYQNYTSRGPFVWDTHADGEVAIGGVLTGRELDRSIDKFLATPRNEAKDNGEGL